MQYTLSKLIVNPKRNGCELATDFDYVDLYLAEWVELTEGSLTLVQAPEAEGQIARGVFAFSGPAVDLTQGYLKLAQVSDGAFGFYEGLLAGNGE